MITIFCHTCRKSQTYDNHSPPSNPDHKIRLLIYEESDSRDYYFCNIDCLWSWLITQQVTKQLPPPIIDVEDLTPAKKKRKRKLLYNALPSSSTSLLRVNNNPI